MNQKLPEANLLSLALSLVMNMTKGASDGLFFLLLSILFCCSSATLVGFGYHARGAIVEQDMNVVVGQSRIRVFVSDPQALPSLSKTGLSLDLYMTQSQLQALMVATPRPSSLSWLQTHGSHIKSVVATVGGDDLATGLLVPTLKSVHSVLTSSGLGGRVKLSVALPCSLVLHNLSAERERELCRVLRYVKKVKSFVIIEETTTHSSVGTLLRKASSVTSVLPCNNNDIPIVLTIKNPAITNPKVMWDFTHSLSKALQTNPQPNILAVHVLVAPPPDSAMSRRELLTDTRRDTIFPAIPAIVTVNPTPVTVTNPEVPIVTVPLTAPPITVPATQPITNPVTTYPVPSGNIPVANPVAPPASNIPGQTWCVARTGVAEVTLQAALDYACGGGGDCSQIQQGGSCYNPNTLQSHASFAFNSYYQKNPLATSCDFGGTAALVNANPSVGPCIYPTSASSSTSTTAAPLTMTPSLPPPTPSVPTPTPTPIITNPATVPTPTWSTPVPGSGGTPPSVLNTSSGTVPEFGLESPPVISNSSTSNAVGSRPSLLGLALLLASLVSRNIVLV